MSNSGFTHFGNSFEGVRCLNLVKPAAAPGRLPRPQFPGTGLWAWLPALVTLFLLAPWARAEESGGAPLPVVSIMATDPDASEIGLDPGSFTFTRPAAASLPALTVSFTIAGTAVNGTDYESIATTIQLAANATAAVLLIKPVNDASDEGTETVQLTLVSDGKTYLLDQTPSATVDIEDYTGVPEACEVPDQSGRCKNQWLIDAYVNACNTSEDACKVLVTTREKLGDACYEACQWATGQFNNAYKRVCNWAQDGVCNLQDKGCSLVRGACSATGVGTGCNWDYTKCMAARWDTCAGRCVDSGQCKVKAGQTERCRNCKSSCRDRLASACESDRQVCIAAACANVQCPTVKCGDDCTNALKAECDACMATAGIDCDFDCEGSAPACREAKQLGEQCTTGQCDWGLRCRPDLSGLEGLGPSAMIETLLKPDNISETMDELKEAAGAGDIDDISLCLTGDDNCQCRLPILEGVAEELDAEACMAFYRPWRHLQAWLVNDAIEGTDDLRQSIRERLVAAGMGEELADEVLGRFQQVAFAYGGGGGVAAGGSLSVEVGTVYGKECYGCYYTLCAGIMSSAASAGGYGTVAVYDATSVSEGGEHGITNLQGWARFVALSVETPIVNVSLDNGFFFGLPLGLNLPSPGLNERGQIFNRQEVNQAVDEFGLYIQNQFSNPSGDTVEEKLNTVARELLHNFIPIGRGVGMSLGVGVSTPILVVSGGLCHTWIRPSICLRTDDSDDGQCQMVPVLDDPPPTQNGPPQAACRERMAFAAPPPACNADVNVDWGSFDPSGAELTYTQSPASPYSIGQHTVTLTVSNNNGSDTCQTVVSVADGDPPVVTCPQDSVHECQGNEQAVVDPGQATATDCDTSLTWTDTELASYPLGTTVVNYSATDDAGNTASCDTRVTVRDTTPPAIECPEEQVVECTGNGQAPISFQANATDVCSPVTLGCVPPSGAQFDLGNTTVACTARDTSNNQSGCTATMTVVDTTPPVISSVTASPNVLWPPNHKMVTANVSIAASDVCDPSIACRVIAVSSDEPDTGTGNGDKPGDTKIVGPTTVELRAERAGNGDGRVYTITVRCADDTGGLATTETVTVAVPHDQN